MPPPTLTRNQAKHLRALRGRKYRHEQQQFVAEGETIVAEVLAAAPVELRYVVCTTDYFARQTPQIQAQLGNQIYCCDVPTFNRLSSLDTPPAALAVLDIPKDRSVPLSGLNLYLDGIRDPGNLGSILRVADWFGHSALYLSHDCVDVYNAKSIQASMGAFLRVCVRTESLSAIRSAHPKLSIVGTRIENGEDAFCCHWHPETLLVIGNESHGIREEQQAWLDSWLSIPRGPDRSGAESLNAAIATGILCAAHLAATRTQ